VYYKILNNIINFPVNIIINFINTNIELLFDDLLKNKFGYYYIEQYSLDFRLINNDILCYVWLCQLEYKNKIQKYSPSTLYFIDKTNFKFNYEYVMNKK
jgi:hypothetical protein